MVACVWQVGERDMVQESGTLSPGLRAAASQSCVLGFKTPELNSHLVN